MTLPDPTYKSNDLTVVNQELGYSGYFKIQCVEFKHKLFAGGWSDSVRREIFERGSCAAVLPYDPVLDQVVLIEQCRVPAMMDHNSPWLLEIIAGVIEPNDETPESVIAREAEEEAGLMLQSLVPISTYWSSPGGTSEQIHLFCGWVDAQNAGGIHGLENENEDIRVHCCDFQAAYAGIASGRINNATTIIALQWLKLHHAQMRNLWN